MNTDNLYDFLADDDSLRQVLNNTRASVYVTDLKCRVLYLNEAMLSVLGKSMEELRGEHLREVFPLNAEEYMANGAQVLAREQALAFEESYSLDGQDFTINSQKFPLRDKSGQIYGIGGISTDITDHREREATLYEAGIAVSSLARENIYDEVVKRLADSLNVDLAFIGKLREGSDSEIDTASVYLRGEHIPQLHYSLAGTPCETVVGNHYRFIAEKLQQLYPGDNMATELSLIGYAGYPMFDSSGKPLGMVAVLHSKPLGQAEFYESILKIYSIRVAAELEKERADEALRSSEEQYRGIFNASADALMFWNNDSGLVDMNPAAEALYGYGRKDFLVLDGRELMSSEHQPQFDKFAEYSLQQHNFFERTVNRRKDGSLFPAEVHGVHMLYEGEPHLLTIVRDISDQVQRETELKQSESRLRATIESALDSVICMDDAGAITEFNHSAEMTFGFSREDVLGLQLADVLIPERYRESHRSGLARYLAQGQGRVLGKRIEVTAQRSDGSEFAAELAINVDEGVDGRLFIGYLRDLTEKHRAEEARGQLESQLRQAQKMEAIGHLTGGIAHDFNNILTASMGYNSMAEERAIESGDEQLQRYLQRSRRSGEKARDLIAQMLTFSRGQRGEVRPVNLQPILNEFVTLLQASLPSSIEFITTIADGLPALTLDPLQVEQVLMNLCLNARDAMEGAGELLVEVSLQRRQGVCASCRQNLEGDFLELSVKDNGPGIPRQTLDRMFEPFYTTKEVGKGSGMGLSTAHGIVHEYDGHILVESQPGRGTCFRVLLPLGENDQPVALEMQSQLPAPSSGLSGRILLVDDDPAVAEYMQELLESWGLEVTSFGNSVDALASLQRGENGYQLAIFDQTMAHYTGLELAREIKTADCDFPVVIYTGYSEEIDAESAEREGIMALLAKPVDTRRLRGIIEETLH